MKKILNYISVLGVALGFCACESDLETTTFDASTAKAAVLEALPETNYELESRNSENIAFTLKWEAPDLGYQAAATNNIEIDVANNDFANARTIASLSNSTQQDITVGNLNSAILQILKTHGIEDDLSARDYEIRINTSISQAATSIYSNSLTINVKPYSSDIQYPEIYVIGDYSGWGWDTAQSLFSFKEDEVNYEGLVDLGEKAANGFKITGETNWDNGNYGTSGAADSEAAEITLINDGGSGNISCYANRFYHFSFSKETLVLKKNFGFNVLSICGDAGSQVSGWGASEVDMNFDPEKQRFYADVELSDGKIKFRADHDWALSFGSSTEGLLDSGDDINVKAGKYRIYVNLNNSNNKTYELNTDDYQK